MTKSVVASILKDIKMNPFASSGDEGRSRYASVGNARYYGDAESSGRSRTVDTSQRSIDRYERDQFESNHSRGRYRSSGSLDRHYQPRMAAEDHYGRRYVDDRSMVQDGSSTVDRMKMPRDATTRREEFRQGMYGPDRHMDDRYEHGYGQPSYDRQRYGYDYQPYDRQGHGRAWMNDRLVYDSRYGVDRSHFEDRMTQDRLDQPGRVRFDGDRQSRSNNRRRSSSIARDDLPRKDSRNTEEMKRARSLPPRQSEEAYYLHGSVAKEEKSSGVTEKRTASRTGSTKDEQEHSRKSSALDEQARRESKGRQASLPRRESERDLKREESQLEKSEVQTECEDREKQPLSRRESEGRQQALSRRESEARQQQLSRRESEARQQQLSRRESEAHQQALSRRESESRQESLSRRESEGRQQALSRRESETQQQQLSRRESEAKQQQLSRRESEARQQAHSRRESESRQESLSRRESEGRQQALSRRESEGRQQALSRPESESRQESLSRRESEGRQQVLSRRESESRQQALSRRESESRQQALSRRESESRQESLSRRESEGRQQALSRRESEGRQQALSRRESESRQQALSRRESESRQQSLSRRDSEGIETALPISDSEVDVEVEVDSEVQEKPLSRRESESQQQSLSRRESEGQEQSLSRRESEVRQQSLSRRDSEKQEHVSSRRESEVREKSLSRRESESESKRESRRQSEERQQSMSRRESNKAENVSSRRESQHERSRRSSEKEGSTSRKSSVAAEVLSNDDIQDIKLIVPTGLRSRSQSQQGSERGDGEQDMQRDRVEFNETSDQQRKREGSARRSVHFGSQYGRDRMPAPIPPYSEPRTTYPTSKDHTTGDNDRSSVRSRELAVRATYDIMRRRYYERSVDPSLNPTWLERGGTADSSYNVSQITDDVLRIEDIDFRCMENAESHDTSQYELVKDVEQPNPVFRRGKTFTMDITFRDRTFEESRDNVYVNFYFGPNPSVPKRTRVVLPIRLNAEFQRVPYQWDARVINQEKNTVSVEISVPVSCPVGMWRCVVDTSTKEDSSSRLQYRCAEDLYVIFNPFAIDDTVFMGDEERRKEFVFNESGKIYTGGYRNVSGRPWIYGQFDDCVLPAVCVLLEMSGLSHAERGNAVKVAKALTSMIKASRSDNQGASNSGSNGLIEAKYEDSYCGGNSPHLWSGSVQIIEEFLRRGATPVKYAHCWVMTGLMTTLCRALGLPARPVTAFVSAVDTQDSLTIDRFIDRFGDIQEEGPSHDQADSLWSFRTWCDVWMHRVDLIPEYSGWQATDPCRTFRDENGVVKGSCGPCPVEALRRGDVGQRDDVDAFFSSMNAYVRYFYEDEESGWGYSPFRQFKYPVSRYVLTKSVGKFDDKGDDDCEDLTSTYRDDEKTDEEKYKQFNSFRGVKDMPSFEYQAAAHNWVEFDPKGSDNRKFDVNFELEMPERVMIGQAFNIPVIVTNNSTEPRTMQTNICTRSSFYTGSLGAYLKRSSTQLTLAPEQSQTVTLTLDPVDYENKLLGMAYVKITVTGFVQETGQSFIDELDFRFNKPCLKIETSPHMKVGGETEAEFSFTNPLDVPLTDCLLTMEMSGSVRPRTIRINRDVRPRESFTLSHSFVTRAAGERQLVACFASRQLSDVVGHRSVMVHQ